MRIEPDPDETERRAILAALDEGATEEPRLDPYGSGWRRVGIRENVDAPDEG